MLADMRIRCSTLVSLLVLLSLSTAHTVITYPGWRGNNLFQNGTTAETNGLALGPNNTHPYGMQWEYPCTSFSALGSTIPALKAQLTC